MKYDRLFAHLKRTTSKSNMGQDEETFSDNGSLWGNIKEMSAGKITAYGMLNSQATTEIRLRQWPDVNTKDRLRDTKFDKLLVIDGITHGDNELVVYAHVLTEVE